MTILSRDTCDYEVSTLTKNRLQRLLTIATLALFIAVPAIHSQEFFEIKMAQDTAYLPYSVDVQFSIGAPGTSHVLARGLAAVSIGINKGEPGLYFSSYNVPLESGFPSIFGYGSFAPRMILEDMPIYMTLHDWLVARSDLLGHPAAIGVGVRNDSAYAFRIIPEIEQLDLLPLIEGVDHNGDGWWKPHMRMMLVEDYDYDGHLEAFVYFTAERDLSPRELICIDVDDLSVEWTVPVASLVREPSFYSCRDSLDPGVIFTTQNPDHGAADSLFSDKYGYLARVNRHGDVVMHVIGAEEFLSPHLVPLPGSHDRYFLLHELDLYRTESLPEQKSDTAHHISIIDGYGRIERSIGVDEHPEYAFIMPFGDKQQPLLHVWFKEGFYRVYDTSLTLRAVSEPCRELGRYGGPIRFSGETEDYYIFSTGVYDDDLNQVLAGPIPTDDMKPILVDEFGAVTHVAVNHGHMGVVGEIRRRSVWALLSTFFLRHQVYFLAALSGLIVALILTNYYRRRSKHNLEIIGRQKQELEKAHEALKKAQSVIIATEKQKQARDIAGGFAHEIRNTLFPARSAIYNLRHNRKTSADKKAAHEKFLRYADDAVGRAIDITDLILQYTKIDAAPVLVPVDLTAVINGVLRSFQQEVDETSIRIKCDTDSHPTVIADRKLLDVLVANLVGNAIDAVREAENPTIEIIVGRKEDSFALQIVDNGDGIPLEDQDRIFDAFYSTKLDRGTGLGLSMVAKIVALHKGTITVMSSPGAGSTFVVALPAADPDQPVETI